MGKLIYTTYTELEIRSLFTEILQPIVASEIQKIISSPNNSPPPGEKEYLTRKGVCKLLDISLPTLSRLITSGVVKPKIVGCSYRFSKTQIDTYMNSIKHR